jgi:hypothetical protein
MVNWILSTRALFWGEDDATLEYRCAGGYMTIRNIRSSVQFTEVLLLLSHLPRVTCNVGLPCAFHSPTYEDQKYLPVLY